MAWAQRLHHEVELVAWVQRLHHEAEPDENLVEVHIDHDGLEFVVHVTEDLLVMHIPEDIEQDHAVLEVALQYS